MPGYIAIDTESSGLFDFRQAADAEGQPRLAEFAAVLLDDDMNLESEIHHYVRPDGWEMQSGATEVNGLTTDFLNEYGKPVAEVLNDYQNAILAGRVVLAHNAQHDCKIMRAELRRAGLDDLFMVTKNSCTMRAFPHGMVEKANGKSGWPQLADACRHVGYRQTDAHSATDDARAVAAIARWLRDRNMLQEPKVHLAKERG